MRNFSLITALSLFSFSWMSVSVSEIVTVEAQPGQPVTLMCNNMTNNPPLKFWFRLVSTEVSCVSVMIHLDTKYCEGFQDGNFEMSSNISTIFLKIKHVDESDSGLYFCGFYSNGNPTFSVVRLNVKGSKNTQDANDKCDNEFGEVAKLTTMILGIVTAILVMVIIGLVVKNRKLQTEREVQSSQQREDVCSDELNYAAVTFRPKGKRREPEPHVIYSSTR